MFSFVSIGRTVESSPSEPINEQKAGVPKNARDGSELDGSDKFKKVLT